MKRLPISNEQIRAAISKVALFRQETVAGQHFPRLISVPIRLPVQLSASWPVSQKGCRKDDSLFVDAYSFNDGGRKVKVHIDEHFVFSTSPWYEGNLSQVSMGELRVILALIARARGWKNVFIRPGEDWAGRPISIVSNKFENGRWMPGRNFTCHPGEFRLEASES
jgi:hypothetical protein